MSAFFEISDASLRIDELATILAEKRKLRLSDGVIAKVKRNRAYLEKKISDPNLRFYGINTGFGALCDVAIAPSDLTALQENLVMSHACGMGDENKRRSSKTDVATQNKRPFNGTFGRTNRTDRKTRMAFQRKYFASNL
jgi:histidine ammonia-lyase